MRYDRSAAWMALTRPFIRVLLRDKLIPQSIVNRNGVFKDRSPTLLNTP
jgi:hypothetical protein